MNRDQRDALRRRTADARRRHAAIDAAPTPADPEDGHLIALPSDEGLPVEWAVIDTPSPERRRVVPFDDQPMIGSADVAVARPDAAAADTVRGPGALRCRFAVDLDRSTLGEGRWAGELPNDAVATARTTCRQLDAGDDVGTAIGREVDNEVEYRAWIEDIVAPAQVALAATAEAPPTVDETVTPFPTPSPPRTLELEARSRWWQLAAVALLAAGLALGWWALALRDQRSTLLAELDLARQPLDALRAADEELRERLASVEADRDAIRRQLDDALAAVPDRASIEAMVDVPLAVLATALARGEPEILTIPDTARWTSLIIQLDDPHDPGPFRLALSRLEGSGAVWRSGELTASRGLLSVLLPSELMDPGAYRLRLDGKSRSIATFTLLVERP